MRRWNGVWPLLAVLLIGGCTSRQRAREEVRGESAEVETLGLDSGRLAALQGELSAVARERVFGARYLSGSLMRKAWAEGGDLLVEAFNPGNRHFEIHAIRLSTGEPQWMVDLGPWGLKEAPGFGDRFVVFLLNGGAGMVVVDRRIGSRFKRLRVPLQTVPLGAAGSSDSTVYLASLSDQRLHALNPATGEPGWGFRSEAPLSAGPLVTPRTPRRLVVVANEAGQVLAFPAAAWNDIPPGAPSWSYRALGAVDGELTAATLLNLKDRRTELFVLVPCEDGGLYCLDGAAGTPRWIFRSRQAWKQRPQVAGGRVFARNAAGMVVLDLRSGAAGKGSWKGSQREGQPELFEQSLRVLAADDGRAYLELPHRKVLRADGRNGAVEAQGRLASFDLLVPAVDANLLVGLTTDGYIVAFK